MWLKWVKGRQNKQIRGTEVVVGYEKMLIYQFSVFGKGFDCYLIRYKKDDEILSHTDPIEGKKHYRLNIELKRAEIGGELFLFCKEHRGWLHQYKRITTFRSDIIPHKVNRVIKGERLVLTFGAAI